MLAFVYTGCGLGGIALLPEFSFVNGKWLSLRCANISINSSGTIRHAFLPPIRCNNILWSDLFSNVGRILRTLSLTLSFVHSFDLRGTHSDVPSHWKSKDILDERGYFLTVTDPATLSLNNVDERDEGVYRCRVDFRRSRSHNFKVRLTIISKYQYSNYIRYHQPHFLFDPQCEDRYKSISLPSFVSALWQYSTEEYRINGIVWSVHSLHSTLFVLFPRC